jgi:cytochrome c oxidase cbb3-type subunit III
MSDVKAKSPGAVQTTGHAWDGDIQEFNNPLPAWWLWAFYATVVFALIYWVLYPAWPVGGTYTKGVLNHISFIDSDGTEKSTHWNTRALLIKDLKESKGAMLSQEYMSRVTAASYAEILADPEMMAFTRSVARGLFGDNCAACHGAGGQGVIGLFPNLADDAWLWGGGIVDIQTTITEGRYGFMPAFRDTFNDRQLDDVATYVLGLSGNAVDTVAAKRGEQLFQTQAGGCYYCHTSAGTGLKSQGAANLADQVWTIADVGDTDDLAVRKSRVKDVIRNGVQRQMPRWSERLSPAQIKLLTVYVHELGGGQ